MDNNLLLRIRTQDLQKDAHINFLCRDINFYVVTTLILKCHNIIGWKIKVNILQQTFFCGNILSFRSLITYRTTLYNKFQSCKFLLVQFSYVCVKLKWKSQWPVENCHPVYFDILFHNYGVLKKIYCVLIYIWN